ncbi:hypothetical protein [Comamonas thiooxydans]|uniref:hypothetical protein n=1 Tax=Comamonas thiooxydans TaxID=363952 RepID=UPI00050F7229|nr:hypothetical protein [Comamonas thiooxydans]KGH23060.1 hypothetical protein P606_13580 [Comamonas thiooxydans]
MPSIKTVLADTSAINSLSEKKKSLVRRFIEDDNKSSPLDEKVLVMVCIAILAFFAGQWLFSYIDHTFFSVVCKADYFTTP